MTVADFRRLARSLPGAVEQSHMEHPDFRVGGKIFATLGYPTKAHGALMLTPREQQRLLKMDAGAYSPAAGKWGEAGATVVLLRAADKATVAGAMKSAWSKRALPPKARKD